jgi:hypothetical protein
MERPRGRIGGRVLTLDVLDAIPVPVYRMTPQATRPPPPPRGWGWSA